jgi:heme O synthase-like polyprenyltransferase
MTFDVFGLSTLLIEDQELKVLILMIFFFIYFFFVYQLLTKLTSIVNIFSGSCNRNEKLRVAQATDCSYE